MPQLRSIVVRVRQQRAAPRLLHIVPWLVRVCVLVPGRPV